MEDEVGCPTWISIAAAQNITSNCSLCPAPVIANCTTQSGDKCLECEEGYSVTSLQDECLKDSCGTLGQQLLPDGTCADIPENCEPGKTKFDEASGQLHCTLCLPGFKMEQGQCTALPDPENCLEVEMGNPRTCVVCLEG